MLSPTDLQGPPCIPLPSIISDFSFDPASQSLGLGYHGRHASVPSSPTQPVYPRHRRLSEPFNAPASATMQFVPSSINVPMANIKESNSLALNDGNHTLMKFKDPKPILFKTELCRSWEEKGSCRYGYIPQTIPPLTCRNKCQFAHSPAELRPVPRHPKYKTQLCKTFLEVPSPKFRIILIYTNRLVPAIMDPVAVLCIPPLALNVTLQSRLTACRGICFLKVISLFLYVCVCVVHHLAYVMYTSILGLFLEFLYFFAFWHGIFALHEISIMSICMSISVGNSIVLIRVFAVWYTILAADPLSSVHATR